jgi:hypothetical protein
MMPLPSLLRRRSRRGWGLAFVVIILAAAHLIIFAVSERAIHSYAAQKQIVDLRAVRMTLESSLGLALGDSERWLEPGAKLIHKLGDYEIELASALLPQVEPADGGPSRPIALPRGEEIAYRLLTASATIRAGEAANRMARKHSTSFRLERRYALLYEVGQPARLFLIDERRFGLDHDSAAAASESEASASAEEEASW